MGEGGKRRMSFDLFLTLPHLSRQNKHVGKKKKRALFLCYSSCAFGSQSLALCSCFPPPPLFACRLFFLLALSCARALQKNLCSLLFNRVANTILCAVYIAFKYVLVCVSVCVCGCILLLYFIFLWMS